MGHTVTLLNDIRSQLAPDDLALKEARTRRDAVRDAVATFPGVLRTFASGSIAHATANCPVHQRDKGLDADGGAVLDRRHHSTLGPDSPWGLGPRAVVAEVAERLRRDLRAVYPKLQVTITKRAILLEFGAPLPNGEDPTVDLVVGLERCAQPGLWIPNTENNTWDPSHPEGHTQLLTANPKDQRVTRARAIRLAKAENKRHEQPLLCSFNLEALALMFVTQGMSVPHALAATWRQGARDLRARLTPDPAGVSDPIKCRDRYAAADRLDVAADRLESALAHDDDQTWVRHELRQLWPEFVAPAPGQETKARTAARLKSGGTLNVTTAGAVTTSAGASLKRTRAYGARH
ncbi:MAG TPA: hypothetical protein VFJ97_13975 [Dermatophilaceae bacterium]|nr:hypothetical protein [Dermatophilaceae bacterium]